MLIKAHNELIRNCTEKYSESKPTRAVSLAGRKSAEEDNMKTKKTTKSKLKKQVPKWVELGEVAIDSGQLVLTDPAYLQGVDGKQFYEQLLSGGDHAEFPGEGGGILNGARLSNTWGKRFLGLM